ncbi:hypothetical protein ACQKIY_00295 [Bacillus mycoides]|uniref:hypothetical protein n=1 Tax=Bacillus mycoides TaxID=1405 RepID=UPI003D072295
MQRMPFERPTDHYDEHLSSIDKKICSLLKERKELSNGNPGFPPDEAISSFNLSVNSSYITCESFSLFNINNHLSVSR